MPIQMSVPVKPMTDSEFDDIAYTFVGFAFEVQNRLGKLCDEKIYENELAFRCQKAGFQSVLEQVPISVTHGSFEKAYYIDLLLNHGAVIELKTVDALTGDHEGQVINYLLLSGLQQGKLINMASAKVDPKTIQTRLTPEARHHVEIMDADWNHTGEESRRLKELMGELVSDWGAFLSVSLYREALCHFLGGEARVHRKVEFIVDGRVIGRQSFYLLNPQTAFEVTALTEGVDHYEEHLRRLLAHTKLQSLEWINLNHHRIVFKALERQGYVKVP